jgi:hypothetical protein
VDATYYWWEGQPGLDWRLRVDDELVEARYAATLCALRVFGLRPATRNQDYRNSGFARARDEWSRWLQEGGLPLGRYLRRIALAMVCAEPPPNPDWHTILEMSKWLHAHMWQEPAPPGGT